jgi:hypothetical protein
MQSRSSTELQRSRHGTPMLLSGLRPQHYKVTCRERPLVAKRTLAEEKGDSRDIAIREKFDRSALGSGAKSESHAPRQRVRILRIKDANVHQTHTRFENTLRSAQRLPS